MGPSRRRSIPARAGEPIVVEHVRSPTEVIKVYPRACGGTFDSSIKGSIPARAGEPHAPKGEARHRRIQVYPRACGGTPPRNSVIEHR